MSPILLLAIAALWVYLLWVLRRAELHAWRFLWGSMGLFILMMVGVRPWLTRPLARYVCAIAGVAGRLTGRLRRISSMEFSIFPRRRAPLRSRWTSSAPAS